MWNDGDILFKTEDLMTVAVYHMPRMNSMVLKIKCGCRKQLYCTAHV